MFAFFCPDKLMKVSMEWNISTFLITGIMLFDKANKLFFVLETGKKHGHYLFLVFLVCCEALYWPLGDSEICKRNYTVK